MEVSTPARIAVYDDAAAAPRVVMVEPKDVRSFLEEITATVNRLSHEQGGTIPFMVIRRDRRELHPRLLQGADHNHPGRRKHHSLL